MAQRRSLGPHRRLAGSASGLSRRQLLTIGGQGIAGLAAIPLLASCSDDEEPATTDGAAASTEAADSGVERLDQVVMAPSDFSVSFVDMLVAGHMGMFDAEGIDAVLRSGAGTSSALQAVIGNAADYTRAGRTALPAIINEGAPLKVIATVQHSSVWEIASSPDNPIAEPGAMSGKRIGVASEGGATEQLIRMLGHSAGLEPDAIDYVVVGVGAAGYQFMQNGEVDGWIVHNYTRKAIESETGEELTVLAPGDHVRLAGQSWTMSAEKAESGSDGPVRFLRALLAGMSFALDESNWDDVFEALQEYNPEAERESFDTQLPAQLDTWTANVGEEGMLDLVHDDWVETVELMHAAGLVDRVVDPSEFLDSRFIEQAKA